MIQGSNSIVSKVVVPETIEMIYLYFSYMFFCILLRETVTCMCYYMPAAPDACPEPMLCYIT